MSDYHYINEKAGSETYHQERLEVFDPLDPHQICPKRSPEAVSEAIKDIIKDKVVCELGCAEGDNMVFMAKYAKKVVGLEYDPNRYNVAVKRGLDVVMEDYFDENYSLPQADVHYVWPVDTIPDNARVIKKILLDERLKGKIIIAGDASFGREEFTVSRLVEIYKGTSLLVPYNEGSWKRGHGTFILGIIDAATPYGMTRWIGTAGTADSRYG